MTLEEAIKNHTVQSEGALHDIKYYTTLNDMEWLNDCKKEYEEFAEEHQQLAEWLKELKIHREIHDVLLQLLVDFDLDICCDDLMDNEEEQKICEENCDNKTKSCWVRWAKMKAREVNADEDSD